MTKKNYSLKKLGIRRTKTEFKIIKISSNLTNYNSATH